MRAATAVAFALVFGFAGLAGADVVYGVPLPKSARQTAPGVYRTSLAFKAAVDHVRRFLARTSVAHQEVPPYRRGRTLVARFLPTGRGPFRAIQVFEVDGRTYIAVIPSPS